ncbi:hypothetical protein K466DRAFT_666311 [Polyporus arcularius HHB13444]|uniref:F-box domain-containing protein n=1 Tax=Polyporus arcularius HHB13444 TaxID=1314778 RepID=A0A5C3NZE2_9APHY|nr:hypothetical protein K466DRAFT_666311 [Polyporus arcularius HHB13444]
MSFLTLPPELTDYIISFLRNDRRTLCACTQVCKGWLPASRAYLFDTIRFKIPHSYTVFVEQVLGSRSMLPYLALIHGIAIVGPDGFLNQYLADKFMRDVHGNLPNLRILRISYVDWGHLTTSDTWKYLDVNMTSPFPQLTKLAINHAVLPSDRVLTRLLVSLPCLTNLSLRSLSFRSQGTLALLENEAAPPHRSTTLGTLWIDGADDFVTPFLCWFVEQFHDARVSLRELGCTPKRWTPASASLLEALGPAPLLSTLLMPFPHRLEADVERVSLSQLTNLTRLNVLLRGRFPTATSWADFAHMLESLGCKPRTHLSVALCYYPTTPDEWKSLDGPGLELLDPVLDQLASASAPASMPGERPRAPAFKFVCYVHQPEHSHVRKCDVDSLVKRKLKASAERGVVSGRLMATAWSGEL